MLKKRMQPPGNVRRYREYLVAEDFVTSEVEVTKGVRMGVKIVWLTLILSTVLLITIIVFLSLLLALFLFPESRLEILTILERLLVELWRIRGF